MNRITKSIYLLLVAVAMIVPVFDSASASHARVPKNHVKKHLKKLRNLGCDTACPIESCSLGSLGFIITKPGVYCLPKPTSFSPAFSGLSAITVSVPAGSSSDVVIDLNGNTLSQDNIVSNISGIFINGQTNVIIRNGTIRNFSQFGILTQNSDQLIFENLNILGNGNVAGPYGFVGGIFAYNATNISIDAVNARENFGVDIGLSGVNNFFMNDSHCDDTQGAFASSLFGNTAFGFSAIVDPAFIFQKNIKQPAEKAAKTSLPMMTASSNLFITNCSFNGSTGVNSAFGIAIGNLTTVQTERSQNIVLVNCSVMDTMGQQPVVPDLGFVEGITVIADNILIADIVVDNVIYTGTTTNHLVGIEVSASTKARIENCTVSNVAGSATFVNGFDIEGFGTNIVFNNCTVSNVLNSNTTLLPAYAAGFAVSKPLQAGFNFESSAVVLDGCVAQNVHGTDQKPMAAGIFVSGQQNILVQNCVTNANDTGILIFDYIPNGTPPPADLLTVNGIFTNNVASKNLVAGFKDLTNATKSNNAYYSNSARSNGHNSNFNYVGHPLHSIFPPNPTGCSLTCTPVAGTTPLRYWDVKTSSLCPCNTNGVIGDKLDNLDIHP